MTKPFKVLCAMTAGYPELVEACRDLDGVNLVCCTDDAAMESELVDADGLVIYASRYTRQAALAVQRSPLRWIHLTTAGIDAFEDNPPRWSVCVSSGGAIWSETVAEHAVAMLLALRRRLHSAVRQAVDGSWDRRAAIPELGVINASRALVVGYGAIGEALAVRLAALGARVTGVARTEKQLNGIDVYPIDALDDLIGEQDAVILCVPRTPQTLGMFDARRFTLMQRGTAFINVSRGGVVDETALVAGLKKGRPALAGLDVYATEPLPLGHPLRMLSNVILTPHVAGFGNSFVLSRMAQIARDNLTDILAGRPPRNEMDQSRWHDKTNVSV